MSKLMETVKGAIPEMVAQDILSVQPFDEKILKEICEAVGVVPVLPKDWKPSRRYVEVSKGISIDYQEMVVPYDDVKEFIKNGWSITRLSKLSDEYVNAKWANAIVALENADGET